MRNECGQAKSAVRWGGQDAKQAVARGVATPLAAFLLFILFLLVARSCCTCQRAPRLGPDNAMRTTATAEGTAGERPLPGDSPSTRQHRAVTRVCQEVGAGVARNARLADRSTAEALRDGRIMLRCIVCFSVRGQSAQQADRTESCARLEQQPFEETPVAPEWSELVLPWEYGHIGMAFSFHAGCTNQRRLKNACTAARHLGFKLVIGIAARLGMNAQPGGFAFRLQPVDSNQHLVRISRLQTDETSTCMEINA